jgi:exodeoxyribonuclease-5
MSLPITLTAHQLNAIDEIVRLLNAGESVVSLTGYAGTGKSSLIPFLVDALQAHWPVAVGAPTHRAALILQQKGIANAATIHSLALTPYFLPAYACAVDFLTFDRGRCEELRPCPTRTPYDASAEYTSAGVPKLLDMGMQIHYTTLEALRAIADHGQDGPRKALASLGIHGSAYFDGFGAKMGQGVLIIDEASMLGKDTLAMCQQAFERILLIGDPGQLPPVKDIPALADVPGVTLTEIHRQAADSPIVQLAYQARSNAVNWYALVPKPGALEEARSARAAAFLTSPLIVWRNATRLHCTHAIRAALGYPLDTVVPGEPLVCRATSQDDRALGFVNNALFRVVEVRNGPYVIVIPDGAEDTPATREVIRLHLEELHGAAIHPSAIPFRFGYCLTAHTAQGGEWATVHIAKPDLLAYMGQCRQRGGYHLDDGARWAYTAITRAKERLIFLTDYTFTPETSMPSKATTDVFALSASPHEDEATLPLLTDDIPDPATPLSVFGTPLPQESTNGVALTQSKAELSERLDDDPWTSETEVTIDLSKANDVFTTLMTESLRDFQAQLLAARQPPLSEEVRITAEAPNGFSLMIVSRKASGAEALETAQKILLWLGANGYKPCSLPF